MDVDPHRYYIKDIHFSCRVCLATWHAKVREPRTGSIFLNAAGVIRATYDLVCDSMCGSRCHTYGVFYSIADAGSTTTHQYQHRVERNLIPGDVMEFSVLFDFT